MKEQEMRKILEAVTDEFVRAQADLWPRIEQQLESRQRFGARSSRPLLRWWMVLGAMALVALLTVWLILAQQAAPASAAEVLSRAESAWESRTAGAEIVFERFSVVARSDEAGRHLLIAEIWRSVDNSRLRYQVVDDQGRLVFLALRSGDEAWRSLHNTPPGGAAVDTVLHASTDQMGVLLGRGERRSPLFRSVIYGLADLDSLLVLGRQTCHGLLCLLGILDVDGDQAGVIGRDRTNEGREVYVLGILDRPQVGQSWDEGRIVRIDAESYSLVEYTDVQGSLLRLLERRGISASDLPASFFRSVPEGIRVLEIHDGWTPPTSAGRGGADRVWIVSVSPEPDTVLTGAERFAVTLGYDLVSAPVANLHASLMPTCLMVPGTGCAGAVVGAGRVIVAAGSGEETVEFVLEAWNLQGEVVLAAYLDTGGDVRFFDSYTWRSEVP